MVQSYKIILLLAFSLGSLLVSAQEPKGIFGENSVEFKRQFVGGPILHTHGFGAGIAWGKRIDGFRQRMYQFEIVTLKHEKEYRTFNPYYDQSKGYVFGKLNQVFLLRPTIGIKRQRYDKLRKAGVEVGYAYSIGPSFAILKPVYLEIGYPEFPYAYVTSERYNPEIHSIDRIFGRASNLKGIDEIGLIPGLHAKFGVVFEYSSLRDGIKGIELGATLDAFPKKVPIMAFAKNNSLFFNFYIQLLFGKKYIQ